MQTTFKKTLRRHTGVSPETSYFALVGKILVGRDRRYFSTSNFLLLCVRSPTKTQTEFWKKSKTLFQITTLYYWLFMNPVPLMEAAKGKNF